MGRGLGEKQERKGRWIRKERKRERRREKEEEDKKEGVREGGKPEASNLGPRSSFSIWASITHVGPAKKNTNPQEGHDPQICF